MNELDYQLLMQLIYVIIDKWLWKHNHLSKQGTSSVREIK